MRVLVFKERFVPAVRAGKKRNTFRRDGKRNPQVGQMLSLRHWTGLPYRSPQETIMLAECHVCRQAEINGTCGRSYVLMPAVGPHPLLIIAGKVSLNRFARLDGFKDWPEMEAEFQKMHGLPFKGIWIEW